jgi:enoyl reductase-like protein
MSENDAETVTIEVTLKEDVRDALRNIRQRQREQLASDSWGRTVVELSEDDEKDDEAIAKLLQRAYSRKLKREMRDPTVIRADGPVGADNQCKPD